MLVQANKKSEKEMNSEQMILSFPKVLFLLKLTNQVQSKKQNFDDQG